MQKEEITGKIDELKGKVKQGIGHATDNPKLEGEGAVDEAKGHLKQAYGKAKDAVVDADKDAGTDVHHK